MYIIIFISVSRVSLWKLIFKKPLHLVDILIKDGTEISPLTNYNLQWKYQHYIVSTTIPGMKSSPKALAGSCSNWKMNLNEWESPMSTGNWPTSMKIMNCVILIQSKFMCQLKPPPKYWLAVQSFGQKDDCLPSLICIPIELRLVGAHNHWADLVLGVWKMRKCWMLLGKPILDLISCMLWIRGLG